MTDKFIVSFLKRSNSQTYTPKMFFSDGDKSFDPMGIVQARQMYDDLESLLNSGVEGDATDGRV